jgi:hypothetical protein
MRHKIPPSQRAEWRLEDSFGTGTDSFITSGTLRHCAKHLLLDTTATVADSQVGHEVRTYWLGNDKFNAKIVKDGHAFHVLGVIGDKNLLENARLITQALKQESGVSRQRGLYPHLRFELGEEV